MQFLSQIPFTGSQCFLPGEGEWSSEQRQINELNQRVKKLESLVAGLREETLVLLEDEPIKRGG